MSQRLSINVIQGYFASAASGVTKQSGGEARPRTYQELTLQAHQRSAGLILQSSGNKRVFAVPPHLANFGRRTGQKLPPAVQQKMESFFSTSFSNVQVHSGPEASAIGALAFTAGSDIYFAPGQYNPHSHFGQELLAHELTHVVQQRAGRVRNPLGSGIAVVQDPMLEAEAERMAKQAATHVPSAQPKMAEGELRASTVLLSSPARLQEDAYKITAQDNGRPVGSVTIHKAGHAVEIADLGVQREHRGKSLGQALINAALRAGLRLGKKRVQLDAGDDGSGRLTKWYRRMGFRQTGLDPRGRPRMEAPISKVLSGTAQGGMALRGINNLFRPRQDSPARIFAGIFAPPFGVHTPWQPSKRKRKSSEPAPKKKKKEQPAEPEKIAGQAAADAIVDWLNKNNYGGDSNYTVGVDRDDDLIISKVNGVTPKSKAMAALAPQIRAKGWNVGRRIFLAQKFNTAVGSNHAEMCILAAPPKGSVTYMKCTNPNCDFCKAALTTYGVTSGNEGGGKVQLGWAHPYYPISYGTQLPAPIAQQVAELESLGKTPKESEVKKGTWLLTKPKSNKWMEWDFSS